MGATQTKYKDLSAPEYPRASPAELGVYDGKLVSIVNHDGTTSDNIRHGVGICTYSDGTVYNGQWHMGKRSGKGTETSPDGTKYEGEWLDDKKHGEGKL